MDIFGDDYYLEIQRHDIDPEAKVNDGLLKLHRKLGVPLVATNDFHFLRATDHDAHDALICIQTNKTVDEKNRLCYPDGLYMKSPEEMRTLFADLPDALERTLEIADKCNVELEFGKTYMPDFPIPSWLRFQRRLSDATWRRRVWSGATAPSIRSCKNGSTTN